MFALPVHSKNEKSEFRAQISQADGSLSPGFVKQRIRLPDTLFFYAQAGQNGLPPSVGTLVLQTKVIEA